MLASIAPISKRSALNAVSVAVVPTPRCLADSREILRLVQSYGEISTYRWLRHEPPPRTAKNKVLAIFRDPAAMTRFLQDCPLTFEIDRVEQEPRTPFTTVEEAALEWPNQDEEGAVEGLDQDVEPSLCQSDMRTTNELERTENSLTDAEMLISKPRFPSPSRPSRNLHTRTCVFRLKAEEWTGNHRDWLERQPFWGGFQLEKSIVQQDLSHRVPLIGLSDFAYNPQRQSSAETLRQRRMEIRSRPSLRDMMQRMRHEKTTSSDR